MSNMNFRGGKQQFWSLSHVRAMVVSHYLADSRAGARIDSPSLLNRVCPFDFAKCSEEMCESGFERGNEEICFRMLPDHSQLKALAPTVFEDFPHADGFFVFKLRVCFQPGHGFATGGDQ